MATWQMRLSRFKSDIVQKNSGLSKGCRGYAILIGDSNLNQPGARFIVIFMSDYMAHPNTNV